MKLRRLLVAWSILLGAGSIAAQSPPADPISGRWQEDGHTLLDLTFDGRGAVSGTIMAGRPDNLAPIKTGTFDPKTGVLKLAGDAAHPDTGAVIPFVIDGTLANDVLNVNATFGTNDKVTKALRRAAQPAGNDTAVALRKSFGEVSGWVTRAADLVPADKYTYRPAPTVRTFGQLIAHVADAHNYYCARATGKNVAWSDPIEKGSTDKVTVVLKLKQSIEACDAIYSGTGQAGALISNVGHTNLHYGNLITYMRMLGLVPPSS